MKKYIVYFEIFDKKMKTIIEAKDESEAKEIVKKRLNIININEIKPIKENKDNVIDFFNKEIFGNKIFN